MERRLKILFVSMHCRPEPCDTRTSQLARSLAEGGHQCTVLTSFPNYPFGKIYPGYRQRIVQKEIWEGVEIVRVPMIPDHSKSKLRRFSSYFSFGASSAILGALFTKRADLIWIHHPPLTTGIAGWFLARVKRVPFVYEIHDLWPESLTSTGMVTDGWMTRTIRRMCEFLHRRADAVMVTSPGMKAHLEAQGLPGSKVHVFPQWADEAVYGPSKPDPSFAERHGLAGKFNLVFGGNMGAAQDLDVILDAAKRLKDLPDVLFVMVGAGLELERLRNRAASEAISNVRFLGQFPAEAMPMFYASADALLLQLRPERLFEITVPSKLQTYLASGKPILCGVQGDAATIVNEARAGIVYAPGSSEALERAVRSVRSLSPTARMEMGACGRAAYVQNFAQSTLSSRYEKLFLEVASGRKERNRANSGQIGSEIENAAA